MKSDIDIDFADRNLLLQHIPHTAAAMRRVTPQRKHNSGVYVTEVPYDPVMDACSLDYSECERRGYVKLDLLNVWLYNHIRDEQHLTSLMREPDWQLLMDKNFVSKLIHVGNHFDTIHRMPEPIDSIPRLAMFLSVIRPGKRHLIGKPWREVAETIWQTDETGYSFKRSHAVSYAHLVVVHMNLLLENPNADRIIEFV